MAKPDDGGAAFPHSAGSRSTNGMALRDWFAGMALQGLIANSSDHITSYESRVADAFKFADLMLQERARGR